MKDKVESFCWVSVVEFEEVSEGLPVLKGNEGEQDVAGEGEVEGSFWSAMSVPIFLPGGGVAFVVIAVLDAPVLANGAGGTGFFFRFQAGKEDAGMALGRLVGVFLFLPVALHGDGGAGAGQLGGDWGDGLDGGFAGVDAPVIAFAAQVKKGEPSRARVAASNRLEVFAFVPMR